MKKLFIFIALTSTSIACAYANYSNGYNNQYQGNGYYQGNPPQNQMHYQNQMYQNQQQNAPLTPEQQAIQDKEIQKKISSALTSWFSKEYQNISFDVNQGFVTLKGTVNTPNERNKAEEKIRTIAGIRQINNQITVLEDPNKANASSMNKAQNNKYPSDFAATEGDKELNSKIRNKLTGWFSNDYEAVVLRTNNGFVILAGTVNSPNDIKKVNDKVSSVSGVRSVYNQLSVKNQ